MDELRSRRVSESMREELSELIRFESSDPRLALVEVTEVVLSPDLRRADILVSLPAAESDRIQALAGLDNARHFLRRKLMERMDLFRMPELRFRPDAASSTAAPVERLLRRVRRGRPRE
ncbi:MAG: 30S ribosome-binding factor RbfA [Acidobacteria bacterium]|nr:30S ribosome-binding factor RbfA [Acidobacteriota bacterium]